MIIGVPGAFRVFLATLHEIAYHLVLMCAQPQSPAAQLLLSLSFRCPHISDAAPNLASCTRSRWNLLLRHCGCGSADKVIFRVCVGVGVGGGGGGGWAVGGGSGLFVLMTWAWHKTKTTDPGTAGLRPVEEYRAEYKAVSRTECRARET